MLREFWRGVGTFFRGFGTWVTSPRLMLLGAIPALIVGAVVLTVFILIVSNIEPIAVAITPFADDWSEPGLSLTRLAAGFAVVLALLLLSVATFTALTLAIGDPFYERIWLAVEAREGGFEPAEDLGFWASIRRGIGAGLRLLIPSIGVSLILFAVGLIPVVGGVLAVIGGGLLGGRLLVRELLGRPFDGRGLSPAQQKALRRGSRARTVGFGAIAYVLFLLPLGAVVAMPAAVAGSTLLAREILPPRQATPPQEGTNKPAP
ncbi:EI24 domain-containing protein [Amnibacterium flavum]|uniref:EI24 domain-containing protein n=1 Tax=Amnibacterium flavum TaxID=2173173 RepID=A0A2V1HSN7_9MICO|nr:EI24 domain-containing protein [Amnibacterium flavum]PVZ94059.1 hypothetical protein DDQ50_09915 [Amnibacterium flavum]